MKIEKVPFEIGFTSSPLKVAQVSKLLVKFIAKISKESACIGAGSLCDKFSKQLAQVDGLTTQSETVRLIGWLLQYGQEEMLIIAVRKAVETYQTLNDILMVLSIGAVCIFSPIPSLTEIVDTRKFFRWSRSAIDLLSRLGLHQLIFHSPLSEVRSLSHSRTGINLACANCKRERDIGNDLCSKCGGKLSDCSLCGVTVKGLWIACPLCNHGGHVKHVNEWFGEHDVCPVPGCGHACTYN